MIVPYPTPGHSTELRRRILYAFTVMSFVIFPLLAAVACGDGSVSNNAGTDGDIVDTPEADEETDGDAVEDDIDDATDKTEATEEDGDTEHSEDIDGDTDGDIDETAEEEPAAAIIPPVAGTPFISAGGMVESPTYILRFGFSVPLAPGPSQSSGYRMYSGSLQFETQ